MQDRPCQTHGQRSKRIRGPSGIRMLCAPPPNDTALPAPSDPKIDALGDQWGIQQNHDFAIRSGVGTTVSWGEPQRAPVGVVERALAPWPVHRNLLIPPPPR